MGKKKYFINIVIPYEVEDASNEDEAIDIAIEMFHCDTHPNFNIEVEQTDDKGE